MLQYKIPQNVGIEDKIVGPFSLRQLIILGVGFGISYTIFALTSRVYELNILEYIIIAIPGLLALAAAVIKIHNVTFTKFILLSLEYAINPKKRYWNHHAIANTVDPDLTDKLKKEKKDVKETEEKRKSVNLSALSATLDSGGFVHLDEVKHEDLDEVDDDDLITQAYFGHRRKEGVAHNMYWRTRDVQKKKLDILAKMPSVVVNKAETEKAIKTKSDLPDLEMPIKINKSDQAMVVTKNKEEKLREDSKKTEVKTIERPPLPTKNLTLTSNLKEVKFVILNSKNEEVANETTASTSNNEGRHNFAFKLPQDSYLIKFKALEGYKTPSEQSVVLNEQDLIINAVYLLLGIPKEDVPELPTKEPVKREIKNKDDDLQESQDLIKTQEATLDSVIIPPKKRKRRRNRKKKQPILETLEPKPQVAVDPKPIKIEPKVVKEVKEESRNQPSESPIPKAKIETLSPKKEITLKDLQAGEEIEFNLD